MPEQTLVVVYDETANAEAALRELRAARIATDAIGRHTKTASEFGAVRSAMPAERVRDFWIRLFGGEPDHDTAVYDRSIDAGSTILTVKVPSDRFNEISAILEKHDPVDIDERAGNPDFGVTAPVARGSVELSAETMSVGKRAVSGPTTRVQRYAVETPVEQDVTLQSEHVTLERRPVTDRRPPVPADFTDKSIEMTEISEQAVVGKTTHVVEEVALRKDVTAQNATVKGSVRRDDVRIEKVPAGTVVPSHEPKG
jgi:uncharacterized protein (TIGR02271 family)